jgi:hypothetical protein
MFLFLVAEAPRNLHRGVQTLKELDREIKFALPSSVVSIFVSSDIDIKNSLYFYPYIGSWCGFTNSHDSLMSRESCLRRR